MISNPRKKKQIQRIQRTRSDARKPTIFKRRTDSVRLQIQKRKLRIYRIVSIPEET
jgi:hypothetical protein